MTKPSPVIGTWVSQKHIKAKFETELFVSLSTTLVDRGPWSAGFLFGKSGHKRAGSLFGKSGINKRATLVFGPPLWKDHY